MSICEEILISEYIEVPGKSCYVFSALDPSDHSAWIYSCSCGYSDKEVNWLPNYNLTDRIWISEYKCRNFDKLICNHIKKAFITKSIVNQINFDLNVPKWAKNLFGKDYYKKALTIVQDLSPIPWGEIREGYTRHGIGKVKMYDPIYYHVQLKYPSKWSCSCNDYIFFNNCIHITQRQILEKHLQNRRELCIGIATKYILENT